MSELTPQQETFFSGLNDSQALRLMDLLRLEGTGQRVTRNEEGRITGTEDNSDLTDIEQFFLEGQRQAGNLPEADPRATFPMTIEGVGLLPGPRERNVGRAALEVAGGTAAVVGTPVVGIPSALQAAPRIAKGAQVLLQSLKGGLGQAAGSLTAEATFDPSADPGSETLQAFAEGTIGEAMGIGLNRFIGGILAPGRGGLIPGAEEAREAIGRMARAIRPAGELARATPTPAQLTTALPVQIAETVGEFGLFFRGIVGKARAQTRVAAEELADRFLDTFGAVSDRRAMGELLQSTITKGAKAFGTALEPAYAQIDRRLATAIGIKVVPKEVESLLLDSTGKPFMQTLYVPETFLERGAVDIRAFKAQARKLLRQAELGFGRLSRQTQQLLQSAANRNDLVTFEEATLMRSDLAGITTTITDPLPGKAQGAAKSLSGLINRAIDRAGRDLDGEALELFRTTNALWKQGKEIFNSKIAQKIINESPEAATRILSRGDPAIIRNVKQIIFGGNGIPRLENADAIWQKLQGRVAADLLDRARTRRRAPFPLRDVTETPGEVGEVVGRRLQTRLARFGDEAMKELFNPVQRRNLNALARTIEIGQEVATRGRDFKMGVQFTQFGAAAGAIAAFSFDSGIPEDVGKGLALIAIAPPVLAKVLTNPSLAKWLSIGFRAPPGSKGAVRAATQIGTLFLKAGAIEVTPQDLRDFALESGAKFDTLLERGREAAGDLRDAAGQELRELAGTLR